MSNLERIREWFGRPLWEMEPSDADASFGRLVRAKSSTRLARSTALMTYFELTVAGNDIRAID